MPLPAEGTDDAEVLADLDRLGSPATMAMAGPRFFGFVIGGSLPVTLAANWLAGAWDQNSALYNATPATARIEQVALRWLVELLGLAAGNAAERSLPARRLRISSRSRRRAMPCSREPAGTSKPTACSARRRSQVIVGEEVHPSLVKSLGMLGLGRNARRARAGRCAGAHARRRVAAHRGAGDRLRAGRQRQHRRDRSDRRDLRARARQRRMGACRRRVRALGRGIAATRAARARDRCGRFVGDRCAQMAQCSLRLRPRVRARRRSDARGDGGDGGISAEPVAVPQSRRLHAGAFAARARRRSVGGVARARARGRRRADRSQLPPGAAFRRRHCARPAIACSTRSR